MEVQPKKISLFKILIVILLAVILITVVVVVGIRYSEINKTKNALHLLGSEDPGTELLDNSIKRLYIADNEFRLYTLDYEPVHYNQYKNDLNFILSSLESLKNLYNNQEQKKQALAEAGNTFMIKTNLASSIARIKHVTDSLLIVAAAIDSVKVDKTNAGNFTIRSFIPTITVTQTDTINSETGSSKKKKGLFGKIKTFLVGEEEKAALKKQTIVKNAKTKSVASPDSLVPEENKEQLIAHQTNSYYQDQLRLQLERRTLIQQKEISLLTLNSRLIRELSDILDQLRLEVITRNHAIRVEAYKTIEKSSTIISNVLLISLAIIVLLGVLVFYSIIQVTLYQLKLIKARKKAESDAIEKGKFLAYMSHEIRTPLSTIIGFSEQLKLTELNTIQTEYLGAMASSSEILLSTVNDILDISKMEAGKIVFYPSPFKPNLLIEEIANSMRPAARKKGMDIIHQQGKYSNVTLNGDVIRLKQLLNNLISNAIKYSDQGKVTLYSSIEEKHGKYILKVDVIDNGIGIAPENLNLVFAEYSQVHDQSPAKWRMGTGLGLPICKKIVEQQGGNIQVTSKLGNGSTFFFEIPYEKATVEQLAGSAGEVIMNPKIFIGKRFLLADDTPINLLLLKTILNKWDIDYDTADDGQQAWEKFNNKKYDIVLTDVFMPNVDGIELTRKIRGLKNDNRSQLPVIVVTANVLQEDISSYLAAGMTDYLLKPFRVDDLYKVLEKNLVH
jgi:signal transduction histidine kinase/CheY-like chemotaxis protein